MNVDTRPALILGNGPSLDKFDPQMMDRCYTIGTNSVFRKFQEWGRETDAVIIVDGNRLKEIGDAYRDYSGALYIGHHLYFQPPYSEIKKLVGRDFTPVPRLRWQNRRFASLLTRGRIKSIFNGYLLNQSEMSFDLSKGFVFSPSVVVPAIQLAASLGFQKILITGVDANFVPGATHAKGIASKPLEPYRLFGFDFRAEMEPMLVRLQICFEKTGQELIDCTPGGKLRFIQKGRLEDYLGENFSDDATVARNIEFAAR